MNHRKVILLWIVMVVGLTLSCREAIEEAPEIEWIRTYDGSEFDEGKSVIQDYGGNFVVAGNAEYSIGLSTKRCAYLLKTDQESNEIWAHTYPHSERSVRIEEVVQTSDSGYILVGSISLRKDPGYSDIYVISIDRDGDFRWAKTFGGENSDWATCVMEDSMGNFVIGGGTNSFSESGRQLHPDFYIVKIDAKGDTIWTKAYECKDGNAECFAIQQHDAGGYLLVGYSNQFLYMLEVDENGDSLWSRKFGDENQEHCGLSTVKTGDGGFAIAGYQGIYRFPPAFDRITYAFPFLLPEAIVRFLYINLDIGYKRNILLTKVDKAGNVTWTRAFGGEFHNEAFSMAKSIDGGYIIAGYTSNSIGAPWHDESGYIIRCDDQGKVLWKMNLKKENIGILYSIIQTDDGGYAATGWAEDKLGLIKLKPEE